MRDYIETDACFMIVKYYDYNDETLGGPINFSYWLFGAGRTLLMLLSVTDSFLSFGLTAIFGHVADTSTSERFPTCWEGLGVAPSKSKASTYLLEQFHRGEIGCDSC